MTSKATKALRGLKTLQADEIGVLKSMKASEMSSDIRCQNHAAKEALRKQVNIWYQDQHDAVRKLSQNQQQAFSKLIKFQNEKRKIQRQSYIQKQRAIQQTLREQAIKDREAAARKFLESTIKKGKKKIVERQKEKMEMKLGDIEENEEEAIDVGDGSNAKTLVSDESVDEGYKMVEENRDKPKTEIQGDLPGRESVDSGIVTHSLNSQNSFAKIAEKLPHDQLIVSEDFASKRDRKVTFVEDETGEERKLVHNKINDVMTTPLSISHHRVTVIDGETGHVEILPRQKTRVVDESAFLRKRVGDMSLRSNRIPDIHRAHLRPSTSERKGQDGFDDEDAVAMPTRTDSDLDRIKAIARENGNSHFHNADDTVTLSRMNTTSSILPPISEDAQISIQADETQNRLRVIDQTGKTDHVGSDNSAVDTSPAKSLLSSVGDELYDQSVNGSDEEEVLASGDDDDDDDAVRRDKIREKRMRERRKLEDDMHKYHVGIANRTFKVPQYEVPPVPRVPVYTRNSVGSLVASEKTVKLASEDFKLPSRRQEYLIKKALEWEEARKEVREKKLREFLAKMKNSEQSIPAKNDLTKLAKRREPFQTQKRDSISHNTMKSTIFGRALVTGSRYTGETTDVNDLRNCRYIRQTSIDTTSSSSVDESYEMRRRKRALDKVSSWGSLGAPHGGSSRTKKRTSRPYVSL
ncbi:uncharacterized protein LOC754474 [Strongylocentrotus purpuratus]|uniref:Uncharacterized protein n=1 Tax=Strongylocentrotus purpuratus TaxID=7668 RepID=A0A7M7LIM0_STRPU|nr:uncharacterized protein LOC754474 [Strongylocentrotus purpuratus]